MRKSFRHTIDQTRAHFRLGSPDGKSLKSLEITLQNLRHAPMRRKIVPLRRASNAAAPLPFAPRGQ